MIDLISKLLFNVSLKPTETDIILFLFFFRKRKSTTKKNLGSEDRNIVNLFVMKTCFFFLVFFISMFNTHTLCIINQAFSKTLSVLYIKNEVHF